MQDTIHESETDSSVIPLSSQAGDIHPDNYDWPDHNLAHKSLELVLSHFIQHTEIVQKKLEIAKQATAQGIEDIQKVCEVYDFDENMPVLKNVQNYETIWDDILTQFEKGGLSSDELSNVEDILKRIPETIRIHYEIMVSQNEKLTAMIELLNRPEYKEAFDLTQKVQDRPNPMSGLLPDEYDQGDDSEELTISDEACMLMFE
ncbi:MAG: hypothetical protein AAF569_01720 [Pseudomonadota bacterium]